MAYIKDTILTKGPFDLIIGFSQGTMTSRNLYKLVNSIDPEAFADLKDKMPKFYIHICAPFPEFITYAWKDVRFQESEYLNY
jgi:hypothetical protein